MLPVAIQETVEAAILLPVISVPAEPLVIVLALSTFIIFPVDVSRKTRFDVYGETETALTLPVMLDIVSRATPAGNPDPPA